MANNVNGPWTRFRKGTLKSFRKQFSTPLESGVLKVLDGDIDNKPLVVDICGREYEVRWCKAPAWYWVFTAVSGDMASLTFDSKGNLCGHGSFEVVGDAGLKSGFLCLAP